MFCDETEIEITAGRGGNGAIAFRREKFVAKGGPNGGNGGHGGSVIFQANENLNTLSEYRTKKKFNAPKGDNGQGQNKAGHDGEHLILEVPMGTIISDLDSGEVLADLEHPGDQLIAAQGGRGGYGNAHFVSSTRQVPRFAELGEPGEQRRIKLELKLVADVGFIGLPSVGKSTLISRISNARPKIADYHFTTLVPNLGVVSLQDWGGKADQSFVGCDVPGLIEGASAGKGLGIQFLKHIMRNRVLVHLLDVNSNDPAQDYKIVMKELRAFDATLAKKPQLVTFNKIDSVDAETLKLQQKELKKNVRGLKKIYGISAVSGEGIKELLHDVWKLLQAANKAEKEAAPAPKHTRKIYRPHLDEDPRKCTVEFIRTRKQDKVFKITGKRLEQIVVMTDFSNEEAVARVYDVLEKLALDKELRRMGAQLGDEIRIGDAKLKFRPPQPKKKRK